MSLIVIVVDSATEAQISPAIQILAAYPTNQDHRDHPRGTPAQQSLSFPPRMFKPSTSHERREKKLDNTRCPNLVSGAQTSPWD